MTLHAYEINFPDFCQLAYLRISYGELKGVFRKEPDTTLMDVYLTDDDGKPTSWQGQIHVVKGELIPALEKLHRSRVLTRYRDLREQSKHSGHSLMGHPILSLARHYRVVTLDELNASIDKALNERPRTYGHSPVAFEVYEFPMFGDVRITLCPNLKQLGLTHEDGETHETRKIADLDRETILAAIIPFLAEQNIRTAGLKAVEKAA